MGWRARLTFVRREGSAPCRTRRKLVEFAARHAAQRKTIDGPRHRMFNRKGRFGLATFACVGLAIAISSTVAVAWNRGAVQSFALIPSGFPMVEGLAVGPDGKVYSPTFNPTGSGPSQLFTFDPQATLLKQVSITGSSQAMNCRKMTARN